MANNFDSNFTRKIAEPLLEQFDTKRVLSKNVDTQILDGKFDPSTGENVDFRRPTDYTSSRTPDGDLTSGTPSDIITGKATGTVQDYITVELEYSEAAEALEMGNIDRFLKNASSRLVVDLERDFAAFMKRNTALLAGAPGTAVSTWGHVAEAGALMESSGVPMEGDWCYATNPFTQIALSNDQRSLGGETGAMDANQKATITDNFAGMKVMTATALSTYTTGAGAGRAGTLSANPNVTYLSAKDSMTQAIAVTGFEANLVVAAGETITITGRNRLNLSTRDPVISAAGTPVEFSGTVTAEVTLDGSGAGTLVITGPAIFEAAGAYNTVDSAPISGDVVTLGGAASTIIQPNMFWHKEAFSIGSVPMHKLYSTDTIATTADGLQIRVSKGADFRGNKQLVRLDLRPAYATLNPFFAGQGFGSV